MILGKNDKLLFIGDSISDYDRKKPVGEGLFNAWGTSYVADAGALLCCMYPELNLRIVNMGISGNQIRDLDERWQTDVLDLKPDFVSILIGINDVWRQFDSPAISEWAVSPQEYANNLRRMAENTKAKMIWMTPYYLESNTEDAMRKRMDEYGGIMKKIAAEKGIPCIDLQKKFERLLKYRYPAYITWDRIHPGAVGSVVIARAFLETVGFCWNKENAE